MPGIESVPAWRECLGRDGALVEAAQELSGAQAGGHDSVFVVEDDHDLAALLDERAAAPGFHAKRVEARVRSRGVRAT